MIKINVLLRLMAVCLVVLMLGTLFAGCGGSKKQSVNGEGAVVVDGESDEFEEFDLLDDQDVQADTVADPLQPINAVMFEINDMLYVWIGKPVGQAYNAVLPWPIRMGLANFFNNAAMPVRLINCLLQGKLDGAGRELQRFGINTTLGILGIADLAGEVWGIESADEDLGQTLAVYGFEEGFYIVWPILGPSTLRDAVGNLGDRFLEPSTYVDPAEVAAILKGVKGVNAFSLRMEDIEAMKSGAVDPYIMMRDAYIQYRNAQIKK